MTSCFFYFFDVGCISFIVNYKIYLYYIMI
ncbi:hypothetical protein SAMN05216495_11623 [Acidaminococcus fermentans]|uniref:Uncharacterized protein n=1 Tax=Acidaminococcus fermentans TaxID=905 RepID=A0A1H2ZS58_ACIFE|nr:hypothetical protein SAMN05216495_11623 [Acidaminococcus fermentans]